MTKRPLSITVISWIFMAVGIVGFAYHLLPQQVADTKQHHSVPYELAWICFVRLLAIVSGVFMLRGFNWARWLAVVWLAYHVVLSAFHSLTEFAMHGVLLAVIGYFLFRPQASAFFRGRRVIDDEQVT